MRKINKSIKNATAYKKWINTETNFPKYYSNHKYKDDILAELLICQSGLCAYTEYSFGFTDKELENLKEQFENGKFTSEKIEVSADLDHFNPDLKESQPYDWNNFFGVFHECQFRRYF